MCPLPMGRRVQAARRRRPLPRHQPQRLAPVDDDSTIAEMRDGELFAWEVTYIGQPVARWEYRLEPTGDAVKLTETVHDRRGRLLHAVSPLITGAPDRNERNADTMESTLQAIKAAAEADSS